MNDTSDTQNLVIRASEGDSGAVTELMERYRDRLKRMVALRLDRRLQKRVDPSDVVQEALIVAANRLTEYANEPSMGFKPVGPRIPSRGEVVSALAEPADETSSESGVDYEYRGWNTEKGVLVGQPFERMADETAVAISHDGNRIAFVNIDLFRRQNPRSPIATKIRIWDRITGESNELEPDSSPSLTVFSSDGSTLIVRDSRSGVQAFDLRPDQKLSRIEELSSVAPFSPGIGRQRGSLQGDQSGFAISSDGMLVAEQVRGTEFVQLRSLRTGQLIRQPIAHPGTVTAISFSPDDRLLITASNDGLIRQWTLPDRWIGGSSKILARASEQTGLELDENGNLIARPQSTPGDTDIRWTADHRSNIEHASRGEVEVVAAREAAQWELADQGLAAWANDHPDDWLPNVLRIRPLIAQEQFDEADAVWERAKIQLDPQTLHAWLTCDYEIMISATRGRLGLISDDGPKKEAIDEWFLPRLLELSPNEKPKP